MLAFIWRTIKDRKYPVIVYIIAAVGFLEMYIALFPSLQKQSQEMAKLLETYPDSLWAAFNIDKASLTFDKLGPYLAMEQFNFIWPILAVIFAIGFAGYALANEVEKGTIEQLLSLPLSREKVFFGRYLAGLFNLGLFTAVSVMAIIPLAGLHDIAVNAKGIGMLAVLSLLFVWAIYSLSFMASSFFSEKSKVSFFGGGLLILMYVLNIVASLKDNLSFLKYFSLFYYYNPAQAIEKATFVNNSLIVFFGIIAISTVLALLWYKGRDIAV